MDQDAVPTSKLLRNVKLAIRSLIFSAVTVTGLCVFEPGSARPTFEALASFTPATMTSLLADATLGCDRGDDSKAAGRETMWGGDEALCLRSLVGPDAAAKCRERALLQSQATGGPTLDRRQCTKPLIDGWPAAGRWLPRLEAIGFPKLPLIGLFIGAFDVAAHLAVPTTVNETTPKAIAAFLGLLQLVLGFGLTVVMLSPVSKWLNDAWLSLLIVVGTLIVGSAAAWVVPRTVAALYDGASYVTADPGIAAVVAGATAYSGGIILLKGLLEDLFQRRLEGPVETVVDKAAQLFIRYVP